MAIDTQIPPEDAFNAVARAVTRRVGGPIFLSASLTSANPRPRSLSFPHRIAYLPLDRIGAGKTLRDLIQIERSWRWLLHEEQPQAAAGSILSAAKVYAPVAAAVATQREAEDYEFGYLNEGPFVEGTEKAVIAAEKLDAVKKGHYEPFLLIAPSVYVAALWLQNIEDKIGNTDIMLTIPPSNPTLPPYEPMTPEAFMDALESLAEQVPAGNDRGEGR